MERWRSTIVRIEPFPRNVWTDGEFMTFCEALPAEPESTAGMCDGVVTLSYDAAVDPEVMAGVIAQVCDDVGLQASSIRGYWEWTVMTKGIDN